MDSVKSFMLALLLVSSLAGCTGENDSVIVSDEPDEELRNQLDAKNVLIYDLRTGWDSANFTIDFLVEKNEEHSEEVQKLTTQLQDAIDTEYRLQAQLVEIQLKSEDLHLQIERANLTIEALSNGWKQTNATVLLLSNLLNDSNATIIELRNQLATANALNHQLNDRLQAILIRTFLETTYSNECGSISHVYNIGYDDGTGGGVAGDGILHVDEIERSVTECPTPQLLRDIRLGTGSGVVSELYQLEDVVVFVANDGVSGSELWATNGTLSGTYLVKDIYPGFTGSSISHPTVFNGSLVFEACDDVSGCSLWSSNGTELGTRLIADINDDPNDLASSPINSLVSSSRGVFFSGYSPEHGYEIWYTDGTTNGTTMVRDIHNGTSNSMDSTFTPISVLNDVAYFQAYDGLLGFELWRSDGTANGTYLVRDLNNGTSGIMIESFATSTSMLYFSVINTQGMNGIWETDGTGVGTHQLTQQSMNGIEYFQSELFGWDSNYIDFIKYNFSTNNTVQLGAVANSAERVVTLTSKEIFISSDHSIPYHSSKQPLLYILKNGSLQLFTEEYPLSSPYSPHQFQRVGNFSVFSHSTENLGNELWVIPGSA